MILYGKDHEDRATELAKAYGETCEDVCKLSRGSDGIAARPCQDATLTVWGHCDERGGESGFAGMLDVEFGMLVRNWKKKNPTVMKVEIVTCDARHNNDPFSGYAARVAKFVTDVYKDVSIKALPVGQNPDDHSILWANSTTRTFCYITAPSHSTLESANRLLKKIEKTFEYNLNCLCQEMARQRQVPNDFTVIGGNFDKLREYLQVIT